MEQASFLPLPEQFPSRLPLWCVIWANALVLPVTVPFYFAPRGTRLEPMESSTVATTLAVAGLIGFIMVLPTLRRHWRLWWPWLVVVFAFTPIPLAQAILHHAEHVRGFILVP
jgi:hypothetical protein